MILLLLKELVFFLTQSSEKRVKVTKIHLKCRLSFILQSIFTNFWSWFLKKNILTKTAFFIKIEEELE